MEYDDFRIEVAPRTEPGAAGLWSVRLVDCPLGNLGIVEDPNQAVALTADTLQQMRSPFNHPMEKLVQSAGDAVWATLMGANIAGMFRAARASGKRLGRGLR